MEIMFGLFGAIGAATEFYLGGGEDVVSALRNSFFGAIFGILFLAAIMFFSKYAGVCYKIPRQLFDLNQNLVAENKDLIKRLEDQAKVRKPSFVVSFYGIGMTQYVEAGVIDAYMFFTKATVSNNGAVPSVILNPELFLLHEENEYSLRNFMVTTDLKMDGQVRITVDDMILLRHQEVPLGVGAAENGAFVGLTQNNVPDEVIEDIYSEARETEILPIRLRLQFRDSFGELHKHVSDPNSIPSMNGLTGSALA